MNAIYSLLRIKRSYSIFFVFLFILSNLAYSQVRFTVVDPINDVVTLHNYGLTTVNINTYQFCSLFSYAPLNTLTIDSGSLMLGSGSDVVISGFALEQMGADLGLYINGLNFGNPVNMEDFLQWGSAGNGRESVAVAKGIWEVGTFIAGEPNTYFFNGGANDHGVGFWDITLSLNDEILNSSVSIYPNPINDQLSIKKIQNINLREATIFDITGRQLSSIDLSQTLSEKTIRLSYMPHGIYFLKITDDQGSSVAKKFIKL
jgi:hypothetical protein